MSSHIITRYAIWFELSDRGATPPNVTRKSFKTPDFLSRTCREGLDILNSAWIYFQAFFVTLISYLWPHPFSSELTILYQQMFAQTESCLQFQKWSFYKVKGVFMYTFVQTGREISHSVLTKAFYKQPRYLPCGNFPQRLIPPLLPPIPPSSRPHLSAHPISTVHCAVVT